MIYGEIIIGPPGSGKSTYVQYKKELLKDRNVVSINLDPGNNYKYFDYDIKQIGATQNFMIENDLGPNYSVKKILENFFENYDHSFLPFFRNILKNKKEDECIYFLFDFPGQVEFFMVSSVLHDFCYKLQKELNFHLACVNLVDIIFFLEEKTRISSYLCCTITMILLELPHVCVFSKCDNFKKMKATCKNNINVEDLSFAFNINENLEDKFSKSCIEIVENESLLNFEFLDYDNIDTLIYLQMIIDKANGFYFNEEPSYEYVSKNKILEYYEK
ncbi:hypothetical protein EDEG_00772 [Edhazardia aedis USNM 41457]|uniref:GPN-loop GTPase 2 n=1 Tax=Edhazardia aedis (strain USNM 41457) TaxID=1003232 RepID=J9DRD9_EDHAE|nr:hypothetical protein EDEG_00772 [Edhazardia aedis USNM 41457]|eukprot:EJW05125.1 hypothetical protein EDEG_00772 [Edhazardia aedis USNM 41457]